MKRQFRLPRFLALWLILSLSLPPPALAMRIQAGLESEAESELTSTLHPAAGAEEGLQKYLNDFPLDRELTAWPVNVHPSGKGLIVQVQAQDKRHFEGFMPKSMAFSYRNSLNFLARKPSFLVRVIEARIDPSRRKLLLKFSLVEESVRGRPMTAEQLKRYQDYFAPGTIHTAYPKQRQKSGLVVLTQASDGVEFDGFVTNHWASSYEHRLQDLSAQAEFPARVIKSEIPPDRNKLHLTFGVWDFQIKERLRAMEELGEEVEAEIFQATQSGLFGRTGVVPVFVPMSTVVPKVGRVEFDDWKGTVIAGKILSKDTDYGQIKLAFEDIVSTPEEREKGPEAAGAEEKIPAKEVRKVLKDLGALLEGNPRMAAFRIEAKGRYSFREKPTGWIEVGGARPPPSLVSGLNPESPPAKAEVIIERPLLLRKVPEYRLDVAYLLTYLPKILSTARRRAEEERKEVLVNLEHGARVTIYPREGGGSPSVRVAIKPSDWPVTPEYFTAISQKELDSAAGSEEINQIVVDQRALEAFRKELVGKRFLHRRGDPVEAVVRAVVEKLLPERMKALPPHAGLLLRIMPLNESEKRRIMAADSRWRPLLDVDRDILPRLRDTSYPLAYLHEMQFNPDSQQLRLRLAWSIQIPGQGEPVREVWVGPQTGTRWEDFPEAGGLIGRLSAGTIKARERRQLFDSVLKLIEEEALRLMEPTVPLGFREPSDLPEGFGQGLLSEREASYVQARPDEKAKRTQGGGASGRLDEEGEERVKKISADLDRRLTEVRSELSSLWDLLVSKVPDRQEGSVADTFREKLREEFETEPLVRDLLESSGTASDADILREADRVLIDFLDGFGRDISIPHLSVEEIGLLCPDFLRRVRDGLSGSEWRWRMLLYQPLLWDYFIGTFWEERQELGLPSEEIRPMVGALHQALQRGSSEDPRIAVKARMLEAALVAYLSKRNQLDEETARLFSEDPNALHGEAWLMLSGFWSARYREGRKRRGGRPIVFMGGASPVDFYAAFYSLLLNASPEGRFAQRKGHGQELRRVVSFMIHKKPSGGLLAKTSKIIREHGEITSRYKVGALLGQTEVILDLSGGFHQLQASFAREDSERKSLLKVARMIRDRLKEAHPAYVPWYGRGSATEGEAGLEEGVEAAARVRAEFGRIEPLPAGTVVGIGPTQAAQHADALRVIGQLLPGPLAERLFVLTSANDPNLLYLYLQSLGLVADNVPTGLVAKLRERFGGIELRADYHGTEIEQRVLGDAIVIEGARIQLIPRTTKADMEGFLQELLATLSRIPFETVPGRFDLKRLAKDIELLIKA